MTKTNKPNYPDCYLHVYECQSGESEIVPIRSNEKLDLKKMVKKWIKNHYGAGWKLDGEIMPKLDSEYYARIMTDSRPPDSVVCWTGGGFYVKCLDN